MPANVDAASRYNIRALLPGPDAALRDAITRLGAGAGDLSLLARHAAVEAIAIDGLRHDETRVIERHVAREGGAVIANAAGDSIVVLASLSCVGDLPQGLRDWGRATEPLADALAEVLMTRGTGAPGLRLADTTLSAGRRSLVIALAGEADLMDNVCPSVATIDEAHDAAVSGAQAVRVAVSASEGLWPYLATTTSGVLLIAGHGEDLAAVLAELRQALASAAEAGITRDRTWVEIAAHTGNAATTATLQRLAQLRGLGVGVIADVTGAPPGGEPAAAVMARLNGADGIRCVDAGPVRAALDAADSVRFG